MMKYCSSIKTRKTRDINIRVVRRKRKLRLICKTNPKYKASQ